METVKLAAPDHVHDDSAVAKKMPISYYHSHGDSLKIPLMTGKLKSPRQLSAVLSVRLCVCVAVGA